MKNFLIDIIYLIFVVIIALIVTKTNYLELIDGNINIDKFYTDIIIACIIIKILRVLYEKLSN